jgi:hypothetical protein
VLVNVRLNQLERAYPHLESRPALDRLWEVVGMTATKEDMEKALCGKWQRASGPSQAADPPTKEDWEKVDAKLNGL